MDFKFVRVDFGASKELIETRQEGKCEEKSVPTHPIVSSVKIKPGPVPRGGNIYVDRSCMY